MTHVRRHVASIVVAGLLCAGIGGRSAIPWGDRGGSDGALAAIGVPVARAASPDASAGIGGDTRSAGEGPGFVGAPLLAILGVVGLGAVTVLATLAYIRLTGGPLEGRETPGPPASDRPDPDER